MERPEGAVPSPRNPLPPQGLDGSPSATTAPAAPTTTPTTDPATTTTTTGGAKPASDDPKVRVKQVHPVVAKVMKHLLTPPVLTAIGLAVVGLEVLAWITLGWAGAVGLTAAVILGVFGAALAWKRAGVTKKQAARKQPGKQDRQDRRDRRRSPLDLLALLTPRGRQAARERAGGGQGDRAGSSGGGGGGLLGRLLAPFRRRGGGAQGGGSGGAHGGAAPGGSGGAHRAPRGGGRGLLAGLRNRMRNRRTGGQGQSGGGHSPAGHGSPSGGHRPPGGGRGGQSGRPRLRLPGWLRRRGGSPTGGGDSHGGGGHPTGGGDGSGHKRTRRGRRGGRGRGTGSTSTPSSSKPKKGPGMLRRFLGGTQQGADDVAGVGVPKKPGEQPKPTDDRDKNARKPEPVNRTRQDDKPEQTDRARQDNQTESKPTPRPEPPKRPEPARNNPAPQGAQHEGNTTMGLRHNSDASLFAYLRNLTTISPALGEAATEVGKAQTLVAGMAAGIKAMATHGDSEQPASKKLIASVEALGQKVAGHAQELEDVIAKIRQAEAEAEALKAEADREHEMDQARREGGRGGLQNEMRADVSRGIQDT